MLVILEHLTILSVGPSQAEHLCKTGHEQRWVRHSDCGDVTITVQCSVLLALQTQQASDVHDRYLGYEQLKVQLTHKLTLFGRQG